jgi:hypothetical protein
MPIPAHDKADAEFPNATPPTGAPSSAGSGRWAAPPTVISIVAGYFVKKLGL